jgi:hypothetical protein
MTINQERFTTYKPLSPVLRTRTTSTGYQDPVPNNLHAQVGHNEG